VEAVSLEYGTDSSASKPLPTTAAASTRIRRIEKWLVRLENRPWNALYRIAIGLVALPALSRSCGECTSGWRLAPALVGILLMLRVVPAAIRGLVPFSAIALQVWSERRQLAKRYDSYQWRKLFWIGIGLSLYTLGSREVNASRIVLSGVCLLFGALGQARWRILARRIASESRPVQHNDDLT
jgi:hypothetical protein